MLRLVAIATCSSGFFVYYDSKKIFFVEKKVRVLRLSSFEKEIVMC